MPDPDGVSEVMSIGILGAGIGIPPDLVARHLSKGGFGLLARVVQRWSIRAFLLGCKSRKHVIWLVFAVESWAAR